MQMLWMFEDGHGFRRRKDNVSTWVKLIQVHITRHYLKMLVVCLFVGVLRFQWLLVGGTRESGGESWRKSIPFVASFGASWSQRFPRRQNLGDPL